ncbi:hypothetical protein BJ742DRAFT_685709 [Cladochytrium replicatum]|nr:hypothetical protein BJ742DRAFT_685709 [Cladochytrium replicatum]
MKGFSTVMAVLAVPSYMTPQDFLTFVGPVRKYVSHFRLVRDSIPNRYIVLLKFRAPKWADLFYAQYNGRRFNSMEPEECHVVYVKSVEFVSKAIPPHAFPPLLEDYQALLKLAGRGTHPDEPDSPPQPATTTSPTHLVELPTCPVCLERMDSTVTGLLTIVCQHTFHCQCLAKWGDSSCPVCRYSQQKMEPLEDSLNECNDCGATVNLWICLICGNIGCGRYRQAHAYQHFADTNHLYSLELETQRVWDYAGDGYVHRLIQNRDDGKLVELPAPAASSSEVDVSQSGGTTPVGLGILNGRSPRLGGGGSRRGGGMASVRGRGASMEPMDEKRTGEIPAMEEQDKVDAVGLEYSYLLISQLESQRHYFEARMEEVTRTMGSKIEGLEAQVQTISVDFDEVRRERDEIKSKLPEILKARQKMEKRAEKLGERVEALERELAEEKEMNRSLRDNQDVWKKEVEAKEAEVKAKEKEVGELKEQVQDLMFFLETQKKVEDSPMREELRSGKVVVTPGGSSSSSQRRKGRK